MPAHKRLASTNSLILVLIFSERRAFLKISLITERDVCEKMAHNFGLQPCAFGATECPERYFYQASNHSRQPHHAGKCSLANRFTYRYCLGR